MYFLTELIWSIYNISENSRDSFGDLGGQWKDQGVARLSNTYL